MTTVESWGLKLVPGKPHKFDSFPEGVEDVILRITNAALGEKITEANERTVVKITREKTMLDLDDEEMEAMEDGDEPKLDEFVLTSLLAGKVESVALNAEFGRELVQFEVIGKNEVHLLGNWIDQHGSDPYDSEPDSDDSEEGGFRLEDVSSDVEIDPEDLELDDDESDGDRFEEVDEKASKTLKRSADAMDEDDAIATGAAVSANGELSKKQKKKLAKKQKNEVGEPVAVTVTETTIASVASVTASPEAAKKVPADGEKKKEKEKSKKKDGAEPAEKSEKKTLPNGLVILDAKKGEGKSAKNGDKLSMRYIGKLEDGKVFDSNTKGKPFTFRLGAGDVIKGWDQGLVGMMPGGERVLTVPSPLAYGKRGSKPEIPPNATLRFEVKLLSIG